MSIGLKIKQRRESLNISQNQLAAKSGVAQSSIHYIESEQNSPTMQTLQKLAAALSVSVADLLGEPCKEAS